MSDYPSFGGRSNSIGNKNEIIEQNEEKFQNFEQNRFESGPNDSTIQNEIEKEEQYPGDVINLQRIALEAELMKKEEEAYLAYINSQNQNENGGDLEEEEYLDYLQNEQKMNKNGPNFQGHNFHKNTGDFVMGSTSEKENSSIFGGIHWIQAIPALIVLSGIVCVTVSRMLSAKPSVQKKDKKNETKEEEMEEQIANKITTPSPPKSPTKSPEPTKTTPTSTPPSTPTTDIEDIATHPTTCSPDCQCECPFPLQKHNCTVGPDGITKYLPIAVEVPKDGSSKYICACGMSKSFPLCDGSHRGYNQEHGTNVGPFELNTESAQGKGTVYICGCGHSKSRSNGKPFCDGSHKNVKEIVPDGDHTKLVDA
jgi:CDGSH-type Zn-finger protein